MSITFWEGNRSILALYQKIDEICIMSHHDHKQRASLSNEGTAQIWAGFAGKHPVGIFQVLIQKHVKST